MKEENTTIESVFEEEIALRDSSEYFLMIEELRDAFLDAGCDLRAPKRSE